MTESDRLTTDVLVIGGGPAGLAAAIRFRDLLVARGAAEALPGGGSVMLIEKGAELGAHTISGAVIDPEPLDRLIPGAAEQGAPLGLAVTLERHALLTARRRMPLPAIGPLSQRGGRLVSLNRLVRWLVGQAERRGVDLAPGFAAAEPLWDGERVAGVRTGDAGLDRAGRPRADFVPGAIIEAGVTIVAEGARGSLTRQIESRLGLRGGRTSAMYSLGLKDVWEIPRGQVVAGQVGHLMGYPLAGHAPGGGFLYAHDETQVSLGLVVGLDGGDPLFDPFVAFQRLKAHPWVAALLAGGHATRSGARVIDEGGWHARPRPYGDGVMLVGESAGLLDSLRLKGVHLAIESGMLAAQTALDALLSGDVSTRRLRRYDEAIAAGRIGRELRRVRNFRQALARPAWQALLHGAMQWCSGGRGFVDPLPPRRAPGSLRRRGEARPASHVMPHEGGRLDRATAVYLSGTMHEENQPAHLRVADTTVCIERCAREYGHPCVSHCPADVYAIEDGADGKPALAIRAANCVHCKTCDIIDPYGLITWTPPEGGGGPRYEDL